MNYLKRSGQDKFWYCMQVPIVCADDFQKLHENTVRLGKNCRESDFMQLKLSGL